MLAINSFSTYECTVCVNVEVLQSYNLKLVMTLLGKT